MAVEVRLLVKGNTIRARLRILDGLEVVEAETKVAQQTVAEFLQFVHRFGLELFQPSVFEFLEAADIGRKCSVVGLELEGFLGVFEGAVGVCQFFVGLGAAHPGFGVGGMEVNGDGAVGLGFVEAIEGEEAGGAVGVVDGESWAVGMRWIELEFGWWLFRLLLLLVVGFCCHSTLVRLDTGLGLGRCTSPPILLIELLASLLATLFHPGRFELQDLVSLHARSRLHGHGIIVVGFEKVVLSKLLVALLFVVFGSRQNTSISSRCGSRAALVVGGLFL